MKIIDTKPIGMPEAKKIMASHEKEKELSYEQKLALEHLNKFTKISYEDSEKFMEELSQVLRMSPETTVKILDIMPQNPDELRMIFAREKFSLKEDEIQKILEITKKYSK
jgi:DNA-directed RNA polymerase subunit F